MIRAPCVFRSDETELHKYSAILAATEPFRHQTEQMIKKTVSPFKYLLIKLSGKPAISEAVYLRTKNKKVDDVCNKYEAKVETTLKSYDMSATTFNTISRQLQTNSQLKSRVILQAYYYKISADLESNLQSSTPMLPNMAKTPQKGRIPFISDTIVIQNFQGAAIKSGNGVFKLLDRSYPDDLKSLTPKQKAVEVRLREKEAEL